ncbi:MAG: ROK family protein [bacterium]|nr:ROK family protein [bacterium]MDN5835577.1 ROK family protein [bacterium]
MLVAVDTGGTKTLVACFSSEGKIISSERFPTPQDQSEYIDQLIATIHGMVEASQIRIISVALPGTIHGEVATWCPNLGWAEFNVVAPLRREFDNVPVLLENDANLAGLAETRMLDSEPTMSLYVTVSTGIGTGLTLDGHISPGLRLSEGGQMVLNFEDKPQQWQHFASGKAIKRIYGKYARDIDDEATWQEISHRISRGLLVLIATVQPEVIIIGGSVGTYFDKYSALLNKAVRTELPDYMNMPPIVQAKNPEEAVIYGCYYYAIDSNLPE